MRTLLLAASCLLATGNSFAGVDVNQASLMDLDGTKGIGPSTSRRILQARAQGPFKDWQDLMARVKGIKPALAAKLSAEGLTVNGEPFR